MNPTWCKFDVGKIKEKPFTKMFLSFRKCFNFVFFKEMPAMSTVN